MTISEKLKNLAVEMELVAEELEYYAGFNKEILEKAKQLKGASAMALEWALHLEDKIED